MFKKVACENANEMELCQKLLDKQEITGEFPNAILTRIQPNRGTKLLSESNLILTQLPCLSRQRRDCCRDMAHLCEVRENTIAVGGKFAPGRYRVEIAIPETVLSMEQKAEALNRMLHSGHESIA